MANILKTIKRQVDAQTKEHLNTTIDTSILGLSSNNQRNEVTGESISVISPSWTRGYYILDRGNEYLTVDKFSNYSGNVSWVLYSDKTINMPILNEKENNLLGVKLFAKRNTTLKLYLASRNCRVRIYTKKATASSFTLNFEETGGNLNYTNTPIYINMEAAVWTQVIIVVYSYSSGSFSMYSKYENLSNWDYLDVTSPAVPTWGTPALSKTFISPISGQNKVTLRWRKNKEIDFGGNGIYRKATYNTGGFVAVPKGRPAFRQFGALASQYINTELLGTLNSGDTISFGNSSTLYTITDTQELLRNVLPNPIFNTNSNWTLSNATLKTNSNARIGGTFSNYRFTGTNTRLSVTSTYLSIDTNTYYYLAVNTENNLLFNHTFGVGGYNITPSNWTVTPSLQAVATKYNKVIITNSGSGKFYTDNFHFSLQTTASYSMYFETANSMNNLNYSVSFHNVSSGATVCKTATLQSSAATIARYFNFTPSISGSTYLSFNIYGTTAAASSATLGIQSLNLLQHRKAYASNSQNSDFREFIEVSFFNSGKSPCATVHEVLDFSQYNSIDAVGDFLQFFTSLPSGCRYIKLGIVASISSVSTLFSVDRNVYFMGLAPVASTSETDFLENFQDKAKLFVYSQTSTKQNLIRLSATLINPVTGATINSSITQHIFDRPKQPTDGEHVTWDDYSVDLETTYSYYLDAYDNSVLKNRSALSSVATIYTGDLTAPNPPTSYSISGLYGGLSHVWTNPTAPDLRFIRCYTDSNLSTVVWNLPVGTGHIQNFVESVAGTISVTRYLAAIDSSGNRSTPVSATGTPLSVATLVAQINFNVVIKDGSNNILDIPELGWYNKNVTASLIYGGQSPIASYFYSLQSPDTSNTWGSWTNFDGTYEITTSGRKNVRFKVKDIYDLYSDVQQYQMFVDKSSPTIANGTFWNYTETKGDVRTGRLNWYNSSISDSLSGIDKLVIKRAKVVPLNDNPSFEVNRTSATWDNAPKGWLLRTNTPASVAFVSYNQDKTEGDSCLKMYKTGGLALAHGSIYSSGFDLISSDVVGFYTKYKPTHDTNDGDFGLQLIVGTSFSTLHQESPSSNFTSNFWREEYFSYNMSSTTWEGEARIKFSTYLSINDPNTNHSFLFDEAVVYKNAIFSTIAEIDANQQSYIDDSIIPWDYYIYYVQAYDKAGNVSSRSPYKMVRSVMDERHKYRNMLNNSSFERVYYSTGGTLKAYSWNNFAHQSAQFGTVNTGKYTILSGNATVGNNYVRLNGYSANVMYQTDINILRYTGKTRKFVLSAYYKKPADGVISGFYGSLAGCDNARNIIKNKVVFSSAVPTTYWQRAWATFYVNTASISYLEVGFLSASTGTIHLDAIQLEENDLDYPTPYYDNVSITADYLQGNLIRSNMIESESIYAGHIKAGEITATQISTNTITTDELKLTDADIFTFENELKIEINSTATIGNVNIAVIGTPYFDVSMVGEIGTNGTIFVGNSSYTFNTTSFNSTTAATLTGYIYPVVSRFRPYNTSAYAAMILSKSSQASLYFSYCPGNVGAGVYYAAKYWSTPVKVEDIHSSHKNRTVLRNDGSSFYYIHTNTTGAQLNLTKRSSTGGIGGFVSLLTANPEYYSFDITSTGSILLAWSTSGSATIQIYNTNTSLAAFNPVVQIPTFGGLSQKQTLGMPLSSFPAVTGISIAWATRDKFLLFYRLASNNNTYYKTLRSDGAILVNDLIDIPFTDNTYSNEKTGGDAQLGIRSVHAFDSDILFYLPATPGKDSFSRPYGGKALYIKRIDKNTSLEDLFNKLAT